ncbi:DUF2726 domain-containing protein [Salinicola socius]|uniref:DUF2726 domain-containing protein n=1 Tax=Salinicola socius TaxID=404433 RepID=A0A1Q8SMI8_9GAMM|nr:DUF2726 domain-containing protein [Salinicola socius]OLO02650.1 hypothetical protein BTW07_18585 [Salinicola socius]
MQLNDLIAYAAITFLLVGVLCVAFLATLNGLFRRIVYWAIVSGFKKGYRGKPSKQPRKVTAAELIERGDAYVKKGRLLTELEQMLFKVLQYKYGETHHVFCQVRVVDVIQPNTSLYKERSREWMALFRQVSQWHFDFVICEKDTMEVVRVIELDDNSHNMSRRNKRHDGLLNAICKTVHVEMERISVDRLRFVFAKEW